jgi:putative pre-16S rRNA nuclease
LTSSDRASRVLGIDVGFKRVGISKTDPLQMFAQPVGTFGPAEALAELKRIQESDGVALAVVGWPLTEEGKEGDATRMVNRFIRRMRKAVPGLEVHRQDEGYTSEEARSILVGKKARGRVDTMAAGLILEEFLNNRSV